MALNSMALYKLMTWFSPSFPVGAFTYSHGLEYAIESGLVTDRATMVEWIGWIISDGAGRVDADLVRESWLAVESHDTERFDRAVEWGEVLRASSETALESSQQGDSFLRAIASSWPVSGLSDWRKRITAAERSPSYAVTVGLVCALHQVTLHQTLDAYLHAMAANLVSAGVRIVPLGQTDGQRALASLYPIITSAAQTALLRPWEDLGSAAPMVDWSSMAHETQYSRLFRS